MSVKTTESDAVVTISAQIPAWLEEDLIKVCKIEERSKSYLVKKALEKFLEEKLKDIEGYNNAKKAYEEFKKSGEKVIPYDQIKKI
jgi:RHH-type rel operon transcriptional repressor/antitoxin RelB